MVHKPDSACFRSWCWESWILGSLPIEYTETVLSFAMSLWRPLLTKRNILSDTKEKSRDQIYFYAHKMNLKLTQ